MGFSAAVIGGVGALSGMFGGGGAGDVKAPPSYQFQNMGGADVGAYGGIQGLGQFGNLATGTLPYAQSTFNQQFNNPYAGGAQSGANFASGLGQNAALGAYGAGSQLTGAGKGALPYAQQIFQTSMDPQQALYNRTFQQTQDAVNAQNAASGISTTPYGAGVAGEALGNFNMNWQNQQLQRQALGAQAGGGLIGQAGGAINTGTSLMNAAPGAYAQASAMPFGTYSGIGQNQNQFTSQYLSQILQAQGVPQQQIQDYIAYLSAGTSQQNANTALFQQQLNQNQMAFNQQQQYGSQLGKSLYGIGQGPSGGWGSFFGGGGGGGMQGTLP